MCQAPRRQDSGTAGHGVPKGVGHPRVETLSPMVFEREKGRGDGVITASFPRGRELCPGALPGRGGGCLGRNVGRVGEVPRAFQSSRDTRGVRSSVGSPVSVWEGVCGSVHLLH